MALVLALGACTPEGGGAGGHAEVAAEIADASPAAAGDAGATSAGWFTDVTAAAGVDFVHDAGLTPDKHLPETMGAGAALFDADGDGDLDLYLLQGGPLPFVPADTRPPNRLFLNRGNGTFQDATGQSGAAAHTGYAMAVTAGDVDGDGDTDLFVTNLGPDVLLLNDGAGHFTDATDPGLADPRWTSGTSFFDADGDGDLDLYVSAYVGIDYGHPEWCGDRRPGWRSYCHPDAYPGLPDRYYRNDGPDAAGRPRLVDATEAAGFGITPDMPGKGLGVLAFDAEPDGDLDLYVANDSVENRLWINRGDGSFEDGTLLSGTGTNARGMSEAGMGLAGGDVDADGDIDLLVTNFDDESNTLYRNDGDGLFTDATVASGLEAPSRRPVGFGTVLADLDHDGDLDLVVANGHIIDNVQLYDDGKTHAQRAQLFVNDGAGRFAEVLDGAGDLTATPFVGRGLYAGDLDGDGDLDLVLTECGGPTRLLRNDGPGGAGPRGGSLVLAGLPPGTRVECRLGDGRVLVREAGPATSYYGSGAPDVHLGLGPGAPSIAELVLAVPGRAPHAPPAPAASGRHRLADDGLAWKPDPPRGGPPP